MGPRISDIKQYDKIIKISYSLIFGLKYIYAPAFTKAVLPLSQGRYSFSYNKNTIFESYDFANTILEFNNLKNFDQYLEDAEDLVKHLSLLTVNSSIQLSNGLFQFALLHEYSHFFLGHKHDELYSDLALQELEADTLAHSFIQAYIIKSYSKVFFGENKKTEDISGIIMYAMSPVIFSFLIAIESIKKYGKKHCIKGYPHPLLRFLYNMHILVEQYKNTHLEYQLQQHLRILTTVFSSILLKYDVSIEDVNIYSAKIQKLKIKVDYITH